MVMSLQVTVLIAARIGTLVQSVKRSRQSHKQVECSNKFEKDAGINQSPEAGSFQY
jgi:hypothetical protein